MADVTRCANCMQRIYALETSTGTKIELNATPNPNGCWTLVKGVPTVAVAFEGGRVVGRLEGFENAILYAGHYGRDCAFAAAERVQAMPGKKMGS